MLVYLNEFFNCFQIPNSLIDKALDFLFDSLFIK